MERGASLGANRVAAHYCFASGSVLTRIKSDFEKPNILEVAYRPNTAATGTEAMMPFQSLEDLPLSLKSHLPAHAQEIFRAAFNTAWATYATSSPHEREELCHRIAWSAVKKKYRKLGNSWVTL
jgi:cation transport regulator